MATSVSLTTSNNSSVYSRFGFAALGAPSSVSSAGSRFSHNRANAPGRSSTSTAKLVFGLVGKNYKPGLLFTQPDDISSTTVKLTFLPLPLSFKHPCNDEPAKILSDLISVFKVAKSKIPRSSAFSAPFSEQNLLRLHQLLDMARLWEECGQIESKYLTSNRIHVISIVDGSGGDELVRRLLRQPNIFEVLSEACSILSCTGLGIPSTAPATKLATSPSFGASVSSSCLRNMSSPLHEDITKRANILAESLRSISNTDSINSLPLSDIDEVIDKTSTLHVPLYGWYAPYFDEDDLVNTVTTSLADSVGVNASKINKEMGTPAEREAISISAVSAAVDWYEDAKKLRKEEQDLNVWITALQRCRKVRALVG